jgi:anaerobic dimethyl sulfoxide reductase subunit B (iron-sulfur subunit)
MGKLGFYYDNTLCAGCRACQVACKDRNDLKVGILYRAVRDFETGKFPNPGFYHYSGTCNHCAEPKCVKGCPTGAMHVAEDGTVQHDKDLCIGCRYCIWNCPYSVPQYLEEKNIVGKCDSCKDLRDQGEETVCVTACDMRALKFGDLDELTAKYGSSLVKELPILPLANITEPSLLIKPRAAALVPYYVPKEV